MSVGYMTAYYETTGWTFDPRWVNNVAYNNETGFSVHKSWRDEFRNNIVFNNTGYNLKFTQEALNNAPHIFSNNLWFTADKANSIEFKGKAVSVAEFQAGVGETNGLSVDPLFMSTVSGSEDFNLQAGSPAKGAGDNGLDLGAFAVYPQTAFGWDANLQTDGIQVYFDQVISASNRGGQVQLAIKLSKAAASTISADILPVAGDALSGEDFTLSGTTVVFQPGETSKTVSVDVIGDADFDELVAFRISNVTNAVPGARNLDVLRINKIPKLRAYAGLDKTVWESGNSGNAVVTLDGSLSQNPLGTVTTYIWTINGVEIATGESPTVTLPIGAHNITLTLEDGDGNSSSDEVVVTVKEVSGIWLEAECGAVGSLWNTETDDNASNGKYVTIKSGNNSNDNAPTDASGLITYSFEISEAGSYKLYARVICPNANDDSFWLKMNSGSFDSWNGIGPSSSWEWFAYPNSYNLSAGTHTLTIGYREDGAKLDKLWLTNGDAAPDGQGPDAGNCTTTAAHLVQSLTVAVYPNPVNDVLHISLPGSPVTISIFNSNGQVLYQAAENAASKTIDMTNFKRGIYLVRIVGQHQTIVRKIIKD
ncbi:T9SS type A sorting domain-containing protein [Prolixibacteraceae bacterium A06]|uniref:T9SS type A sorting domain-containing protein n=2 Tax=Gaoshiqia sediminis TaxID=2986998 RepID=A0AA41YBN3_9BACT|nr:T9SS type A sorting domain-containing protein [Gaoshiqia sediminis]